jgi:mono/diheme cytochrome c family protein
MKWDALAPCENCCVRPAGKTLLFFALVTLCTAHAAYGADKKAAEEAGAVLFRDKGCGFCHGADLMGTKKAPALAEIRRQKVWTPEKITAQIVDGGLRMPPFRESLSDEEIQQLIAFLRAKNRPVPPLPATPGTPQQ